MLKRITLVILCINLVGCSSVANSSTLRNRNFDYERANIENFPQPLKTPQGLTTPNFTPQFNIPSGQNHYLPSAITEATPPDFNKVYPIPQVKSNPNS
jgi:uncharacterized lipoprotein